jgi:hypothetical protein
MSEASLLLNRRGFLPSSASVRASGLFATSARAAAEDRPIRPFHINVPEAEFVDLRRRIRATRGRRFPPHRLGYPTVFALVFKQGDRK